MCGESFRISPQPISPPKIFPSEGHFSCIPYPYPGPIFEPKLHPEPHHLVRVSGVEIDLAPDAVCAPSVRIGFGYTDRVWVYGWLSAWDNPAADVDISMRGTGVRAYEQSKAPRGVSHQGRPAWSAPGDGSQLAHIHQS